MYVRYNTDTQKTDGRTYREPYSIDGQLASLPEPWVELEIVREEPPEIPAGKMLEPTRTANLEAGTFTYGWALVDLPEPIAKAQAFQAAKDAGFTLQPEGWVLGLQDTDRNQFTQLLVMHDNGETLGAVNDDSEYVIHDKFGTPHTVTGLRYRQIIAQYGQAFYTLWAQYA